jgi:hypothetical protein
MTPETVANPIRIVVEVVRKVYQQIGIALLSRR